MRRTFAMAIATVALGIGVAASDASAGGFGAGHMGGGAFTPFRAAAGPTIAPLRKPARPIHDFRGCYNNCMDGGMTRAFCVKSCY